jgi:hypothetical protein
MFFSKPKPPVGDAEREWIETSLMRLIGIFGYDYFRKKADRPSETGIFSRPFRADRGGC